MKKNRKFLSLFLSVLSCATLVSCGEGNNTSAPSNTGNVTTPSTKNEDDRISIEKEEIEISQNDTIEKELEKYINKLQKKYEVYNLLSDLGQARLLGKYIDEIITIKKEELIFPL